MKDALGHGSNNRGGAGKKPIPDHPYHSMSDMQLRYIQKDAHEAGRNAQEMGDQRGINKYADQVNDASTVLGYRARGGKSDAPADALHSGTAKSSLAPVHDSMAVGDRVHLGFGAKGGAGFFGRLTKNEGGSAEIKHDNGKTYSGPSKFLSK